MGKHRKQALLAAAVIVVSACFAGQAFAWGSATHAYISDHIGKGDRYPLQNLNEIYGSMAPDVFAYLFDYPAAMDSMYYMTHYDRPLDGLPMDLPSYLDLWRSAKTLLGRSAAWGFVSHNGETGGDATAHGRYDYAYLGQPDTGYIIGKAVEMARSHSPAVEALKGLGIEEGRLLYELCHIFIESAIDIKLTENNPALCLKISTAALTRSPEFPSIFAETYANAFSALTVYLHAGGRMANPLTPTKAKFVILKAENDFRKNMISYGLALAQKESKDLVAENLAGLATDYLTAYGLADLLPTDPALITALSQALLKEAYDNHTAGYAKVINDTITMVALNMK